MSTPTLTSLQAQINDIITQLAALTARFDSLATDKPVASFNNPVPEKQIILEPQPVASPIEACEAAGLKITSYEAAKFIRFCRLYPNLDAQALATRWYELTPEQKAKFNPPEDDDDD